MTQQAAPTEDPQLRVLLRTATSKDAVMSTAVLARAGIQAQVCATLPELAREIGNGAGALLVSEEMLTGSGAAEGGGCLN